jgi:hypothetical protein
MLETATPLMRKVSAPKAHETLIVCVKCSKPSLLTTSKLKYMVGKARDWEYFEYKLHVIRLCLPCHAPSFWSLSGCTTDMLHGTFV